ncbi:MAG: hypothetical protein JF887_11610 [Candidatus Dormibacteraeota bacterium]|uniref:Uncharacterized protein n=1 Tax=Candidatus Amunia macphersoniae TaxID=3127014 RepID=A0A934NJU2_9BACT|nr:hypothetical protein [Candidatus Dormibacteraeota bacterium]
MRRAHVTAQACFVIAGSYVILLGAGCGSTAASTTSPTVTRTVTPVPGPQRPSDARQAVLEAIARTAGFTDVTYDQANSQTSGGTVTSASGTITATRNPPRTQARTVAGSGTSIGSIQDLSAGTICTTSQGGLPQRYTGQSTMAETVDPFYDLKADGSAWAYQTDAVVNGQVQWHVTGKLSPTLPPPSMLISGAVEAFIDSHTGKIVKAVETFAVSSGGVTSQSVQTYSNFVYNTGATVAPC